ncbi:MAG: YebC/PmpR family DNA-binding transcriptional regulator [Candidatus Spechtbacterales bacterium]
MSGHSKWSTIKHKKAATDKKRGDTFSKMARLITIAARAGGGDLETNYTLRSVVDKARSVNMPKDNIERAIKKGTGELAGEQLEELLMEAYGPGGAALLVAVVTDNRNRSAGDIRHILGTHNGKLATAGSVQWLFERQGVLQMDSADISDHDEFELAVIDAGATDIAWEEGRVLMYTTPDQLQPLQKAVAQRTPTQSEASLEWYAKDTVALDEKTQEQLERLFEALDDHDDVQGVYTNAA